MSNNVVVVFCKAPRAGNVKTRLAATIGEEKAAAIYKLMTERLIVQYTSSNSSVVVYANSKSETNEVRQWLGCPVRYQVGHDLGERMSNAIADQFDEGAQRVVVVGTDAPLVTSQEINQSFAKLEINDVVFGPARDGGYYLVGVSAPIAKLFDNIEWSSSTVLRSSIKNAGGLGLNVALLDEFSDVDTDEDLLHILETAPSGFEDFVNNCKSILTS